MKKSLLCLALTSCIGLTFASGARAEGLRHDIRHDRVDIRHDARDLHSAGSTCAGTRGTSTAIVATSGADRRAGDVRDLRRDLRTPARIAATSGGTGPTSARDARDLRYDRRDLRRDEVAAPERLLSPSGPLAYPAVADRPGASRPPTPPAPGISTRFPNGSRNSKRRQPGIGIASSTVIPSRVSRWRQASRPVTR